MPAVAGLTLTDATGTGFTVTAALPVFPSLVAVIVTAPAPAPVTSPVEVTVATAGVLDAQVTDRPDSTLPAASFSAAVPFCPSLVAVIVAAPTATPVTSPVTDTVAIAVFELAHVIARPPSTFPAASFGVAVSCTVPPTYMLGAVGLTATEATGTKL